MFFRKLQIFCQLFSLFLYFQSPCATYALTHWPLFTSVIPSTPKDSSDYSSLSSAHGSAEVSLFPTVFRTFLLPSVFIGHAAPTWLQHGKHGSSRVGTDGCNFQVWTEAEANWKCCNSLASSCCSPVWRSPLRARTRRKSFSFSHHYLSLFLKQDIFRLSVSRIDRVIDEW